MLRRILETVHDVVRQADLVLLGLCSAATLYGIVLIWSATNYRSNTSRFVLMQAAGWVLGVALYFFFSTLDVTELTKKWKWLLVFDVGFILLLLTPYGTAGGTGNRAWLDLPFLPMNIQPAEVVKVPFILLLGQQFAYLREEHDLKRFTNVLQPTLHTIFMVGLIVVISGDAGSALVYLFVFICMAYFAGMAKRWLALGLGGGAAAFYAAWDLNLLPEYMKKRFLVVLDHSYDVIDKGFQQTRGLLALGGGGWTGQGLFHGTQTQSTSKWSLPERQTDFIFCVCGEELGFVGCVLVIVLLLAIIVRCFLVARDATTQQETFVCVGMASMLIFQTLANIGMCLFVLPVIGLTLPFFSYGGSSIVTLFAAMGIVSGVKKRSRPEWLMN